jgi:hypothetical protein
MFIFNDLIIPVFAEEVYIGVSGPECRPNSGNKNRKQIL